MSTISETPTSSAVDLGCRYSLEVEADGSSLLAVELGWVALEAQHFTVYVSAGTECRTSKAHGAGIPRDQHADKDVALALDRIEQGDAAAEEPLLAAATARDRASLWHVLARAGSPERREAIYRRLVALGAHAAKRLDGIRAGDKGALESWGRELGLVPPSTKL